MNKWDNNIARLSLSVTCETNTFCLMFTIEAMISPYKNEP